MTKILVIEPHRILQQGLAISLYPENDVQLMAAVPENISAKDFDAAVIDAASLRENNGLDATALRVIESWEKPTIWIQDEPSAPVRGGAKAATVKPPVARQALLAALRECLGPSGAKENVAAERGEDKRSSAKAQATEATSAEPGGTEVIELTEVVEDAAGAKSNSPQKKKS
jgi:hypothetical protein